VEYFLLEEAAESLEPLEVVASHLELVVVASHLELVVVVSHLELVVEVERLLVFLLEQVVEVVQ